MKLGRKVKVGLVLFALAGLFVGWQALRFWWYRGYESGERTGVVQKFSVLGTPLCKYAVGELMITPPHGASPQSERWTFSVDDRGDGSPLVKQLRQAERTGTPVTVRYRRDMKTWWRCNPNEYFVTAVER